MKKISKILVVSLLVLATILSFVACGGFGGGGERVADAEAWAKLFEDLFEKDLIEFNEDLNVVISMSVSIKGNTDASGGEGKYVVNGNRVRIGLDYYEKTEFGWWDVYYNDDGVYAKSAIYWSPVGRSCYHPYPAGPESPFTFSFCGDSDRFKDYKFKGGKYIWDTAQLNLSGGRQVNEVTIKSGKIVNIYCMFINDDKVSSETKITFDWGAAGKIILPTVGNRVA